MRQCLDPSLPELILLSDLGEGVLELGIELFVTLHHRLNDVLVDPDCRVKVFILELEMLVLLLQELELHEALLKHSVVVVIEVASQLSLTLFVDLLWGHPCWLSLGWSVSCLGTASPWGANH